MINREQGTENAKDKLQDYDIPHLNIETNMI